MIRANVRNPDIFMGDLHAQEGAPRKASSGCAICSTAMALTAWPAPWNC
jgi:hypothetical protein